MDTIVTVRTPARDFAGLAAPFRKLRAGFKVVPGYEALSFCRWMPQPLSLQLVAGGVK
jgi:hypothetical protein